MQQLLDEEKKTETESLAADENKDVEIIIVGISGATRSGKGTLAKKMYYELGGKENCIWLCQDGFFLYNKIYDELNGNWEDPRALDHDAFLAKIKKAIDNLKSKEDKEKTKYIVLEGFLLFYDKRIVELLDYKIWMNISRKVCYHRRMTTKPVKPEYFDKNLWPGHLEYKKQVFDDKELITDMTEIDGTLKSQEILQIGLKKIGIDYEIQEDKAEPFDNKPNEIQDNSNNGCSCIVL